jgi:hypothetical protein
MEKEARQKEDALTARLTDQFARERVQIETNARAVLKKTQIENAEKIDAIKAESSQREVAAREQGFRLENYEIIHPTPAADAFRQESRAAFVPEATSSSASANRDGIKIVIGSLKH